MIKYGITTVLQAGSGEAGTKKQPEQEENRVKSF